MLALELIRQRYGVIGLDTGFYKERTFYRDAGTMPLTLAKDLRHVGVEDLKDVEAVVHVAELSNDPAGTKWRRTLLTKSTTRVRFVSPN